MTSKRIKKAKQADTGFTDTSCDKSQPVSIPGLRL